MDERFTCDQRAYAAKENLTTVRQHVFQKLSRIASTWKPTVQLRRDVVRRKTNRYTLVLLGTIHLCKKLFSLYTV